MIIIEEKFGEKNGVSRNNRIDIFESFQIGKLLTIINSEIQFYCESNSSYNQIQGKNERKNYVVIVITTPIENHYEFIYFFIYACMTNTYFTFTQNKLNCHKI